MQPLAYTKAAATSANDDGRAIPDRPFGFRECDDVTPSIDWATPVASMV